jgi:glycosyltransferase involved in cell wall biosynthesis
MGEYARSLAIAEAAGRRWQGAAIHFLLSGEAPYAAAAPFPKTLLPSSPTFHSADVVKFIADWRPDVVIFDNAGRTAQLRAARRCGARIVYVSARRRQRRKAFRWAWMRLIDEHWIAYPEFIAGSLSFFETLKLRLAGRPRVRYLDVILPPADAARRGAILLRSGVEAGAFVLVVPGGGTGHPGADAAALEFVAAARALAAKGVATLYVGPARAEDASIERSQHPCWHHLGVLPQSDLAELMRAAQLIVANGGSTLLQALACGKACVAVPIAKDQFERTRRCVAAGVAVAAGLGSAEMVQAAEGLLQNETRRAALMERAALLGLADGLEVALGALQGLVASAQLVERR